MDGAAGTDSADGRGGRAARFRFLVRDRAGRFAEALDAVLAGAGIDVVKIPPCSRRADACAERWVGTVRFEVTGQMLIIGPRHLRAVLEEYVARYDRHRPYRGGNLQPPDGGDGITAPGRRLGDGPDTAALGAWRGDP